VALSYIDNTGYHYPDYPTVLTYVQDAFKGIYGVDTNLDADTQDGALVAIFALALYDEMAVGAEVYNNFSPSTGQGTGLSRNVKINGIRRQDATFSTVDLVVVGTTGTVIENGIAEDEAGQKYVLPTTTIPLSGTITVTAIAQSAGAQSSSANAITKISTPTLGWQSVNNPSAVTVGRNLETDAELRIRQKVSTALPSQTVLDGLTGEIANIAGVTRYKSYENDTNITDGDGIPPHSISEVVEGGDSTAIANAILLRKTAGCGTYGTTSVTVNDSYGIPHTMKFSRPINASITITITIQALRGYLTSYAELVKQALVDSVNSLNIGDDVILTKLYVPANLPNTTEGETFNITDLKIARDSGTPSASNVTIAFNEVATSLIANITVTVV